MPLFDDPEGPGGPFDLQVTTFGKFEDPRGFLPRLVVEPARIFDASLDQSAEEIVEQYQTASAAPVLAAPVSVAPAFVASDDGVFEYILDSESPGAVSEFEFGGETGLGLEEPPIDAGFLERLMPDTPQEFAFYGLTFAIGMVHPILGIGIALARLFNFLGGTTDFTSVQAPPPDGRLGDDREVGEPTAGQVALGVPRMNGFIESDLTSGTLNGPADIQVAAPTPRDIFAVGGAVAGAPNQAVEIVAGKDNAGAIIGGAAGYQIAEVPGALVGAIIGART